MTESVLPGSHDTSYQPPLGAVLLLSCMDLRFLDEIAKFMAHDNLVNRYDHVVLAGAALGALGAPGAKDKNGKPIDVGYWRCVFFDHLDAAIKLHQVSDVYILEHRHCGAYYKVFHVSKEFGISKKELEDEKKVHLKYAKMLDSEIQKWAKEKGVSLRTHRFLMDLRGRAERL